MKHRHFHGRGHPHHPFAEMQRGALRFMGARLHRRLFVSMGVAIFATFAALAAYFSLTGPGVGPWNNREAARELANEVAATLWEHPERRGRLAEAIARAARVDIVLIDSKGVILHQTGALCEEPLMELPVAEPGGGVGIVRACGEQRTSFKTQVIAGFAIAALVLWLASGAIARRLGRPLSQLVHVTEQIGAGDLKARVRLGRHQAGEVGILAESVNEMARRLEAQLEGQKELLASVSHEIRTPLARLRVLTELLRDRSADERLLADAEREIAEIDDLTGQLLAHSRLEFGVVDKREVDLVDVAREAQRRVGLELELITPKEPLYVSGDATLLGRAVVNLLQNAVVHAGGATRIVIEEREQQVSLWVEDDGPGFGALDLRKVFRAFVRSASSPASKPGSEASSLSGAGSLGLGLSLVERIARAHGGRASAENRSEGGARVGFSVDRSAAAAPASLG